MENRASRRFKEPRESNNRKGMKRAFVIGRKKFMRTKQFIDNKLIVHYNES